MIPDLIFAAFGVAAVAGYFKRDLGYIGIIVSSVAFLALEFRPGDYLSYFSLIASLVWIVVGFYSISYGRKYGKWLSSLLPLMIMGMALILVSSNYLEIISGWEIMSIPAYLIVALNKKNDGPAFTFMLFSEFSTILIISGAAFAYFETGSLQITALRSYVPLLLISLGSLIKMGMTPFMISEWLPIAHGNAPANASATLSATMTLMGVFFILKMVFISPYSPAVGVLFLAIGGISILFSSIYAYTSENMKMLAGFSTIENNAAILAAIGLYIIAGSSVLQQFLALTIMIFSLSHSLSKTGLFISIGNSSAEYFSEIDEGTSYSQRVGTFISTMSLSGLFPTIGGLATWMLLEAFFMQAHFGGAYGIIAIVVGSVIALGEGMATGGMIKIMSFGTIFGRKIKPRAGTGDFTLSALAVILVILFAVAVFIVPPLFVSGIPGVLIFNGFMITSSFGGADFGLVSPDYIIILVTIFSVVAYSVFGKPRMREVPAWNGGNEEMEPFTSFAFSNNIRLMLRRILRTSFGGDGKTASIIDIFWLIMNDIGKGYRRFCRFITLGFMNSSIGWYMIYMIAAFMTVMLIAVTIY